MIADGTKAPDDQIWVQILTFSSVFSDEGRKKNFSVYLSSLKSIGDVFEKMLRVFEWPVFSEANRIHHLRWIIAISWWELANQVKGWTKDKLQQDIPEVSIGAMTCKRMTIFLYSKPLMDLDTTHWVSEA